MKKVLRITLQVFVSLIILLAVTFLLACWLTRGDYAVAETPAQDPSPPGRAATIRRDREINAGTPFMGGAQKILETKRKEP